jgi:hypothetical protein
MRTPADLEAILHDIVGFGTFVANFEELVDSTIDHIGRLSKRSC